MSEFALALLVFVFPVVGMLGLLYMGRLEDQLKRSESETPRTDRLRLTQGAR